MTLATGDTIRSLDALAYYNSATYASPTWVEIEVIQDVQLGMTKAEKVLDFRGNNFSINRGLLKNANIVLTCHQVVEDAFLGVVQAAFFANTEVEVALMDGATNDAKSEGLRVTCEVFEFSRSEAIADTLMWNIVLKPSSFVNAPAWFTGSGS